MKKTKKSLVLFLFIILLGANMSAFASTGVEKVVKSAKPAVFSKVSGSTFGQAECTVTSIKDILVATPYRYRTSWVADKLTKQSCAQGTTITFASAWTGDALWKLELSGGDARGSGTIRAR